jgi:hypothetical protein
MREVQAHHRLGVPHDGQVSEPRGQDRVLVHGLGAGHRRAFFRSLPLYLEDAQGPAIVRSMPQWQKRIFTALVRNSGSPAADFCLPADRTLSVATLIEI